MLHKIGNVVDINNLGYILCRDSYSELKFYWNNIHEELIPLYLVFFVSTVHTPDGSISSIFVLHKIDNVMGINNLGYILCRDSYSELKFYWNNIHEESIPLYLVFFVSIVRTSDGSISLIFILHKIANAVDVNNLGYILYRDSCSELKFYEYIIHNDLISSYVFGYSWYMKL